MPPNSASNLKIEVSDENLLANSGVSGIDESDSHVQPGERVNFN